MREFVEQVVQEIIAGVRELDSVWQHMFLEWLGHHASQVCCIDLDQSLDCLSEKLSVWLDPMSLVGILWEYRLIMGEIEWWKSLEQASKKRIASGEIQ